MNAAHMNVVLEIAVSNAVFAAGLAIVVFGVTRLVRRPALAAGLWLLVLAKLVTPPLWTIPVGAWVAEANVVDSLRESRLPLAERVDDIAPPRDEPITAAPELSLRTVLASSGSRTENLLAGADEPPVRPALDPAAEITATVPAVVQDSDAALPWAEGLLAVWLAGTLVLLTVTLARAVRFERLVRQLPAAPPRLQEIADELSRRFGLRRTPRVLVADGRIPPLLWALRRPAVVLPAELLAALQADEQRMLLAHELAHYRRGDHLVRWFEAAVAALYWWHPAVWWSRRELRRAEEACCDAWVLWAFPAGGREYAHLLLDTMDFLSGARTVRPALASGFGPAHGIKRRLNMILKNTTARRLSGPGRAGLLVAGAVVLGLSAGWSQAPAPEKPLPAGPVEIVADPLPQPGDANPPADQADEPASADVSSPAAGAPAAPAQTPAEPFPPSEPFDPAPPLAAPATPLAPARVAPAAPATSPAAEPAQARTASEQLRARRQKVVDALVAALDDKDSQVRASAAYALGRGGHRSDAIVTALTRVLREATEPAEIRQAAWALGKAANPSRQSLETLIATLSHDSEEVRESARTALREITKNPPPQDAIDALVQALRHDDKYVRDTVQESLQEIGWHTSYVVQALAAAIKSENARLAENAYTTLSGLTAPYPDVLDALIALLEDEHPRVPHAALKSLGRTASLLPSEKAIDALIQAAGNENAAIRRGAIQALGGIGAGQATSRRAWPIPHPIRGTSPYPANTTY